MSVEVCQCEHIGLTLVRNRLWPATPVRPGIGFHFDLLDQMEALLLECQVAAKDFSAALLARLPWLYKEKVRLHKVKLFFSFLASLLFSIKRRIRC